MKYVVTFLSILCWFNSVHAQLELEYDSIKTKMRKNIVRWNPTPMGLVGTESFVLGYERVIQPHQSVSINIGTLKLRQFVNLDLDKYGVNTSQSSGGYSLAIDYRRYFKKRNRGFAPDGLYWGPYFTHYNYNWELGFNYIVPETQARLEALVGLEINSYHLGVEVGYQFIMFKRVALDLIFIGPSFGRYTARFYADGKGDFSQIDDVYKDMFEELVEKYPALGTLVEYKEVETGGTTDFDTFGMRYVIQIGILF